MCKLGDKSEKSIFLFDNGQLNTFAANTENVLEEVSLDLVANLVTAIKIQKEQATSKRIYEIDELLKNIL